MVCIFAAIFSFLNIAMILLLAVWIILLFDVDSCVDSLSLRSIAGFDPLGHLSYAFLLQWCERLDLRNVPTPCRNWVILLFGEW